MADWSFLTSHARVLLCIAHDPGVRLRDIAARTGVTERTAYGIVTDLTEAGYVVKHKDGRRNRYQIQAHLPLPEAGSRERTIGEILALLAGASTRAHPGGHHLRSPAALTAVPLPAGRASRRRRRYPGWRVAAPPRPGAIPEGANRVRPADAAGPVTADPHARIGTNPASQSDRPHAKPTRPGRQPSSQEARLTYVPETLRHTGAASSNPHRYGRPPGDQ